MADAGALYGLVGGLGAAAVGGAATIFGPLLLHRRQARQQRALQAFQDQQEMIEEQRKTNAEFASHAHSARMASREWLETLRRIAYDLRARRRLDIEKTDAELLPLAKKATEHWYLLATASGIPRGSPPGLLGQGDYLRAIFPLDGPSYADKYLDELRVLRSNTRDSTDSYGCVVRTLNAATLTSRAIVLRDLPSAEALPFLQALLTEAEAARRRFVDFAAEEASTAEP
ncbi:hypothetical protein ACQPZ8_18045 [Actinomadura nitritigenes]|uniref:hypothetical protein n=1 Tax=Actinomadura nitritigenes TaxID=134602 RepID=UPI003D906DA5